VRTHINAAAIAAAIALPGGMAAPAQTPGGAAATALPLVPNAQAQFKAGCRKAVVAQDPRNAKWVDGHCAEVWKKVVATGPAADALLGVLPATPGAALPLAVAKARMAGVRWGAPQPGRLATGRLGPMEAGIIGRRAPETASLSWAKVGEPIPFDMVGAMEARGAKLTLVGCDKLGVGEGTRSYSGTAPGRAPFGLTIDVREAPTADANSSYNAVVSLSGRAPPRGNTACEDF
jgi:hypothetical protein